MVSIIAKVSKSLKGIHFPVDREKCIDYAKKNMAPEDVLNALERIPEGKYESMAGLWHAVSQEKR